MGATWIVIVMAPEAAKDVNFNAALASEFTNEAEARAYFDAQCKEHPTAYVHLATARATYVGTK